MQGVPSKNPRNGRLRRRFLARRLEILRAAGREFRVRGFAETGMRDIADAASLSPANLYNYFRGKHEILFFCQDSSLDRMIAALEKARHLKTSAAAKLRLVIVSHLRCLLDEVEGSAAHLLTNALPPRQQRYLVAKRDRYELGVRNLVAAGMRSGEFVSGDAALAARAMLGALNWSVQWFSPEGPLSAAEIAEGLADYLIRGLLAKPDSLQRIVAERARISQMQNQAEQQARKKFAVG
ncbi:MAG TPA: TetR/AcrR family transcriptional regulator [Candidatus Acidoferrum sp.]|nr:TetR/AcrR family transcriptional regulator [Candidatus Acidoferrum sp.]